MRILVNALPVRRGGGVSYLEQQLAAFARVAPDLEFHTLMSPWSQAGALTGRVETVRVRSVPTRFLYEQVRLPFRKFDVLYCPVNFGPVLGRGPMVLTLRNAHYYRSGLEMHGTEHLRPWWKVMANHRAMKHADAVVAISHYEAEEALATVPSIAHKLHVVHSASPDWPSDVSRPEGMPDEFILTVANSAAHKRTVDVVAGWAESLSRTSHTVPLVIVGSTTEDQRDEYLRIAGDHACLLRLTGPIADRSQLRWVYEHALALVSMSQLESFGFTPVEAASVGCPVVLSDIPAHREVNQRYAYFVSPGDTSELGGVLARGIEERHFRSPEPWPVTWDDNARALADLFAKTAAAYRR